MTIITADDLTTTASNTAQTLKCCDILAGDTVHRVEDNVVVNFQATADTAFNSTTRSIGDTATGVTKWTSAAEANQNGTVVPKVLSATAATLYTAADKLAVTFNAITGKSLSAINKGELHVFFGILRVDQLSRGNTASIISTK